MAVVRLQSPDPPEFESGTQGRRAGACRQCNQPECPLGPPERSVRVEEGQGRAKLKRLVDSSAAVNVRSVAHIADRKT